MAKIGRGFWTRAKIIWTIVIGLGVVGLGTFGYLYFFTDTLKFLASTLYGGPPAQISSVTADRLTTLADNGVPPINLTVKFASDRYGFQGKPVSYTGTWAMITGISGQSNWRYKKAKIQPCTLDTVSITGMTGPFAYKNTAYRKLAMIVLRHDMSNNTKYNVAEFSISSSSECNFDKIKIAIGIKDRSESLPFTIAQEDTPGIPAVFNFLKRSTFGEPDLPVDAGTLQIAVSKKALDPTIDVIENRESGEAEFAIYQNTCTTFTRTYFDSNNNPPENATLTVDGHGSFMLYDNPYCSGVFQDKLKDMPIDSKTGKVTYSIKNVEKASDTADIEYEINGQILATAQGPSGIQKAAAAAPKKSVKVTQKSPAAEPKSMSRAAGPTVKYTGGQSVSGISDAAQGGLGTVSLNGSQRARAYISAWRGGTILGQTEVSTDGKQPGQTISAMAVAPKGSVKEGDQVQTESHAVITAGQTYQATILTPAGKQTITVKAGDRNGKSLVDIFQSSSSTIVSDAAAKEAQKERERIINQGIQPKTSPGLLPSWFPGANYFNAQPKWLQDTVAYVVAGTIVGVVGYKTYQEIAK